MQRKESSNIDRRVERKTTLQENQNKTKALTHIIHPNYQQQLKPRSNVAKKNPLDKRQKFVLVVALLTTLTISAYPTTEKILMDISKTSK